MNEWLGSNYSSVSNHSITAIASISGATHRLEKVTFSNGQSYIVKYLQKENWLGLLSSEFVEWCESIAGQVSQEFPNLTQAAVLNNQGHYLSQIDSQAFLLLPYHPGVVHAHWSLAQARLLGAILAKIHGLALPQMLANPWPLIEGTLPKPYQIKWQSHIDRCHTWKAHRREEWVIGHRDLHVGNVLWSVPTEAHLIDWESAGLIHPFVELIGLASNAAGVCDGLFDPAAFKAVLDGYQEAGGDLIEVDEPLWSLCDYSWLLWLLHQSRRGDFMEMQKTDRALSALHVNRKNMQILYAQL